MSTKKISIVSRDKLLERIPQEKISDDMLTKIEQVNDFNSIKLKMDKFFNESREEKLRDSKGKRNFTHKELKEFSKEFIPEYGNLTIKADMVDKLLEKLYSIRQEMNDENAEHIIKEESSSSESESEEEEDFEDF